MKDEVVIVDKTPAASNKAENNITDSFLKAAFGQDDKTVRSILLRLQDKPEVVIEILNTKSCRAITLAVEYDMTMVLNAIMQSVSPEVLTQIDLKGHEELLRWAAKNGDVNKVKELLNPKEKRLKLLTLSSSGPLEVAIENKHTEVIKVIIEQESEIINPAHRTCALPALFDFAFNENSVKIINSIMQGKTPAERTTIIAQDGYALIKKANQLNQVEIMQTLLAYCDDRILSYDIENQVQMEEFAPYLYPKSDLRIAIERIRTTIKAQPLLNISTCSSPSMRCSPSMRLSSLSVSSSKSSSSSAESDIISRPFSGKKFSPIVLSKTIGKNALSNGSPSHSPNSLFWRDKILAEQELIQQNTEESFLLPSRRGSLVNSSSISSFTFDKVSEGKSRG
jgi:hypothetical protein